MQLFKSATPVQFTINARNKGNGEGFNPNFKLERTRFPVPTMEDVLTRMIIKHVSEIPLLNIGDVLRGTRAEFIELFGTQELVNKVCQSAVQTKPVEGVVIEWSNNIVTFPTSVEPTPTLNQSEIVYEGVTIKVQISVNGVIFDTVQDAKDAIDMSRTLLKVS